MNRETRTEPLIVLYDRACAICRAEMHGLKARDRHERVRLVDIAAPDFDERDWGWPMERLQASLHVRLPDGHWRIGVVGVAEVYRAVGSKTMSRVLRVPGVEPLAERAYRVLARNRYRVSRWFGYAAPECAGGRCAVRY